MVESVPAVDGSNIFGVIEEVRANCALCSDRHLMLLSDVCQKRILKSINIKHYRNVYNTSMHVFHVKAQKMSLWCAHMFVMKNGFGDITFAS